MTDPDDNGNGDAEPPVSYGSRLNRSPDPPFSRATVMTADEVWREVHHLRSEMVLEIRGLRELLNERHRTQMKESTQFATSLSDRITRLEGVASTHLTREEYNAGHESLRASVDNQKGALAEHKAYDIKVQGDLQGAMTSLRSRYAGVSVALGVIMTVLIVLITVVEATKK